jgi:hypothetical protein
MEATLRGIALQASGALAILVAILHGVIAERRVFPKLRIEPDRARPLLRMVWQAGTVAWIGIGVLLIATPTLGSERAHRWIVAVAAVVYGYGALGNAVANRWRHPGWLLMVAVTVLALLSL